MANYMIRIDIISAFRMHPIFFITLIYLALLNIVFIINSFRENNIKVTKWVYPRWTYLIVFFISIIVFTIVRNIV